jgi:hypothetical protein
VHFVATRTRASDSGMPLAPEGECGQIIQGTIAGHATVVLAGLVRRASRSSQRGLSNASSDVVCRSCGGSVQLRARGAVHEDRGWPEKGPGFRGPGAVIDGLSSRDNVTGAVTNKPALVDLITK